MFPKIRYSLALISALFTSFSNAQIQPESLIQALPKGTSASFIAKNLTKLLPNIKVISLCYQPARKKCLRR